MNSTTRDFLSDVNNGLKSLNLDGFFPPRWIIIKAKGVIADFLAKDNNSNKLVWKQNFGWSTLDCIEMVETDATSCNIDSYICQKVMKSKYPLPAIYETKFGSLVRQATSVDYSHSYDPVFSSRLWEATQKREFSSKKYYFFQDSYLVLPIPKKEQFIPETLTLEGYFKDLREVAIFNSKQECSSCKPDEVICKSPLDYDLVCPTYLIDAVKRETVNQILGSYSKLIKDEFPNLNQNQPVKTN